MIAATASIQKAPQEWKWPLDLRTYDKAAALSTAELREIRILLKHEWRGRYQTNVWIPRFKQIRTARFSTHRKGSHLVGNIAVRSCG